jgi:iron complex transport system ATP-binding protein
LTVPILTIQNATVVRSGKRILDDISLTVPEGEHIAIVGPNGSGKSSLIKLIMRRHYPLAGRDQRPVVEIFGRARWDIFELQSLLGIVSSDLHREFIDNPQLTAFDSVVSGYFASLGVAKHHIVTQQMLDGANSALAMTDAAHLAQRCMSEMSTGEARRILIARALVSNPRALLLDEPTVGLDIAAMRRFMTTVRQIAQSGKTLLLVTHHIEEIIPEINRVVLMKCGKIFKDGPKSTILTSEVLSELYEEPISISEANGFYSAMVAV